MVGLARASGVGWWGEGGLYHTIVIAEVLVQVNTAMFAGSVGPVGVALKVCSSVLFVNVYV